MLWSRDADEYLLPTERRVIRVRQYWAGVWKELTLTALVRVGNGGAGALPTGRVLVDNVTFYLALVAVARFTVLAHLWWSERIVITDKRLMWDRGIITQNLGMMPLSKVTDLTFQRTLGGRILGYGTVIVESAGQDQAFERIKYIPRPEEVYEALSELVFGDKGRTRATDMSARPWWRR